LWYQWRMDEESERRKKYSDSRRKNVSSRYEHTHEDTYEERMKLHMETETETETENININKKVFIKPTTEEVKNYALEAGLMIDSDAFCDYFKSNGWKVGGRAPMKDWRAAVRNWCRRDGKPKLTNAQKQTLESFKQFDERMKRDAGHI